MRGSWPALLAAVGDVREVPVPSVLYSLFSVLAALAMWSLARRFCENGRFWATLLFLAVPAFVVNGGSFEADLPFLALWMTAVALFVKAVDERFARWRCYGAASGLGALAALGGVSGRCFWCRFWRWYVCSERRPRWYARLGAQRWPRRLAIRSLAAVRTAPAAVAVPAAVLAGYHRRRTGCRPWRTKPA
jgi:4-amino-4-deoxy-L-arabinose transferase-like glycosyltransferase